MPVVTLTSEPDTLRFLIHIGIQPIHHAAVQLLDRRNQAAFLRRRFRVLRPLRRIAAVYAVLCIQRFSGRRIAALPAE